MCYEHFHSAKLLNSGYLRKIFWYKKYLFFCQCPCLSWLMTVSCDAWLYHCAVNLPVRGCYRWVIVLRCLMCSLRHHDLMWTYHWLQNEAKQKQQSRIELFADIFLFLATLCPEVPLLHLFKWKKKYSFNYIANCNYKIDLIDSCAWSDIWSNIVSHSAAANRIVGITRIPHNKKYLKLFWRKNITYIPQSIYFCLTFSTNCGLTINFHRTCFLLSWFCCQSHNPTTVGR